MKDSQSSPDKVILFAYFAHQVTPLERQQIETWLTTADDISPYFTYLDEWERHHPQFYPDLEQARRRYEQFRQKSTRPTGLELHPLTLPEPSAKPEPTLGRVGWLRSHRWLAVAASVLLMGGLWLSANHWYYATVTNGFSQLQTIQLPDGSGVVLGANSSLRYARFGFGRSLRRVWLTGEAQFTVTHQPDANRFTVQTPDQTVVEVLGTVFVVNSRANATRVILETGRIRLTTPRSERPLNLVPGDVVTVSAKGFSQKQYPSNGPARITWQDYRFVFADTPLTDVARQLHDVFGVTVTIAKTELMNRTVSGTFQAQTADDLLQALTLMMNLRMEQSNRAYILTQ